MSLPFCYRLSSPLSSVICCWWTACVVVVSVARALAFPRASPLGGIAPMSHKLFWRVCVYFRMNASRQLAATDLFWLSHCVSGWVLGVHFCISKKYKKAYVYKPQIHHIQTHWIKWKCTKPKHLRYECYHRVLVMSFEAKVCAEAAESTQRS